MTYKEYRLAINEIMLTTRVNTTGEYNPGQVTIQEAIEYGITPREYVDHCLKLKPHNLNWLKLKERMDNKKENGD